MEKLVVKFPFRKTTEARNSAENEGQESSSFGYRRSERKSTKSNSQKCTPTGQKVGKNVPSKERVRKHREKIKANAEQLAMSKEKKKLENQKYRLKLKAKREKDAQFNETLKKKNSQRMRKLRKKWADQNKVASQKQTPKHNDRTESKIYKSTAKVRETARIRKSAERVRRNLPEDSEKWAKTVDHIIQNATPRRKSMLSKSKEKMHSGVKEVLELNKLGRPRKEYASVKKQLAFTKDADDLWTKKNLDRYKRRKAAQKSKSKPKIYKDTWQIEIGKFLEENSRIMPNKKDTLLINGEHIAKRHLLMSKVQLYKKFKKTYPHFQRRFITFLKMIPKYYKSLDLTCRRVCVCLKDYNLEQMVEALNKKASAKSMPTASVRTLSDLTLCPYEHFPSRNCIDRSCDSCGVEAVQRQYTPLIECSDSDELIKYYQWEQVPETYTAKDGKKKTSKRWVQTEKRKDIQSLVNDITDYLKLFSGHLFRVNFQHYVQTQLADNLPLDHCLIVVDYSENISLVPQDEIESAHWTTKQVTLYPIHITRHAPESTETEPKIMKESLVVLSDHLTHKAYAVYVFTEQLIVHLQNNQGPKEIKVIHRFSDNCATQFKCKDAFGHISSLESKHNIQLIYHYSESGHGKGPSDGLGAAIKRKLEGIILGGRVVNNAYQAYLALTQTNERDNQKIIYVPEKKIVPGTAPSNLKVKTVNGTQTFHMVRLVDTDPDILECRDLGCYCKVCLKVEEGVCPLKQYRSDTRFVSLETGKDVALSEISLTKANGNQSSRTNTGGGLTNEDTNTSCVAQGPQGMQDIISENLELQIEHDTAVSNCMSDFSQGIAIKGWKICGYTPQDGNCFFHAVCNQIRTTHTELRDRVVKYMKELPEEKRLSLGEFLTTDVDPYLNNMSRDGTYVDHVVIQNMCNMLSCRITIVHSDPATGDLALIPQEPCEVMFTLYAGYLPELQHYVRLERLARFEVEDFVTVSLSSGRHKSLNLAKVLEVDDDVKLKFPKPSRSKGVYEWPEHDEISWEPSTNILKKLGPPTLLKGRGLRLKFDT